jgi:hypothetical protein
MRIKLFIVPPYGRKIKDYFTYFFLAFLAASIALFASNLFFVLGEWVFLGLPTPVFLFAIFIDWFL